MVQKCVPGGMPRHSLHHHRKHTLSNKPSIFFIIFSLSMEHFTQQRGRNEINGIHKKNEQRGEIGFYRIIKRSRQRVSLLSLFVRG